MLSVLTSFHHLDTLTLRHFTPNVDEDIDTAFTASFPSIRNLHLEDSSIQALEVVEHLPCLSTLSFSLSEDAEAILSVGPQWRHLQHLRVRYTLEILYLAPRLSTVDSLQISGHEIFRGLPYDDDTVPLLAPLLSQINPLSIFLSLNYIPHLSNLDIDSSPMWKEIACKSSRLRSFELDLKWGSRGHPDVDWRWILVRLSFRPTFIPASDRVLIGDTPSLGARPSTSVVPRPFRTSRALLWLL